MKTHSRRILITSLVFVLIAPVSQQIFSQSKDFQTLVGTWDIDLPAMGMQMEFVFSLEEDTPSGEMVFEMGSGVMENIVLENNKLSFFVSVDAGGQVVGVDVTAEVLDGEMTGMMATDMGDMDFTGTKRSDQE
jgi:hypothetical protein